MQEPDIWIDGRSLTHSQAMAVRIAITSFHSETSTPVSKELLGPIADAYHQRLTEVLMMMDCLKP